MFVTDEPELTPDQLTAIASEVIGQNWEMIAPFLGIDHVTISQIKDSNSGMINQILAMLRLWSSESPVTFTSLKSVLKDVPESVFIDREKLNGECDMLMSVEIMLKIL